MKRLTMIDSCNVRWMSGTWNSVDKRVMNLMCSILVRSFDAQSFLPFRRTNTFCAIRQMLSFFVLTRDCYQFFIDQKQRTEEKPRIDEMKAFYVTFNSCQKHYRQHIFNRFSLLKRNQRDRISLSYFLSASLTKRSHSIVVFLVDEFVHNC